MKELMKLAEEEINYRKPSKYSDKDRTKIIKHRVNDNVKSQMNGVLGATIGAGIGLGAAMGNSKAISVAFKKLSPEVQEQIIKRRGIITQNSRFPKSKLGKTAVRALKDRRLKKAIAWTAAAGAGAKAGYLPGKTIGDAADLERLSRRELHREPTEEEYKRVSKFSNGGHENPFATKYLDTPSAIVQSNKRKQKSESKGINKSASDKSKVAKKILGEYFKNPGAVGGTIVGATAGEKVVDKLSPDENKHKGLKKTTGAIVGGVAGGMMGKKYIDNLVEAKNNIFDLAKGTKEAAPDLEKMVKEEIKKRKKGIKK